MNEPGADFFRHMRRRTGSFPSFLVLPTLVLIIASLYWAQTILIPIALSILLTFLLSPVAGAMTARRQHADNRGDAHSDEEDAEQNRGDEPDRRQRYGAEPADDRQIGEVHAHLRQKAGSQGRGDERELAALLTDGKRRRGGQGGSGAIHLMIPARGASSAATVPP